jgi:uncharacterized membrane protein
MSTDLGAHGSVEVERSVHQYTVMASLQDLLCGFTGLSICLALLSIVPTTGWLALGLMVSALLFFFYLIKVCARCRSRIEVDGKFLRVFTTRGSENASRCIAWDELDRLELAYFCTRRDGRGGWLQLRLSAGTCTVRLDSRLTGFECVLARAIDAARTCGVVLGSATASNLASIGFEAGSDAGDTGLSAHDRAAGPYPGA